MLKRYAPLSAAMALFFIALPAKAQEPPQRVIAAGGAITEIAYALGRNGLLAGVDTTSEYPPQALNEKPNVGYVRALSTEGLLSLKPDLVLAIDRAGPPDVLALIREAKVPVTIIPEDFTEEGVAKRIRLVGLALGATQQAEKLAASVEADFAVLARERAAVGVRKRILFVLSIQNGRVLVGGRNSAADAIIALAGGINAAEAVEGFKPLSDEGLIAAAPDVIVMMQRGSHALPAADVFAQPGLALVPAAKRHALVTMDGLLLLGFGPRTPHAARTLMREILAAGTVAGRSAMP